LDNLTKVLLPNIRHIIFCEFTKLFDFQIHRIKRMNLRIATDCKWNHLLLPCFSSCKYHVLKKKDLHKSFPGIDIPLTFPSEIIPALFPYYAPDIFFLQITDINLKKFVSRTRYLPFYPKEFMILFGHWFS